jgi:hypothetical protein
MPPQPTVTEIRLNNITACLVSALALLEELNDAFGPPFMQLISSIVLSLITAMQVIVRGERCCTILCVAIECKTE